MKTGAVGAGGAFKSLWKQMAMGLGVGAGVAMAVRSVVTQFKDVIQKGREFEREWANTTTMLTISAEETDKLKQELMNLSPTLGDTTELAKGMYQVLSASIEPAKAIEFLGVAAKAAKAGITDVYTSVDALTTVINAYGMQAEEATRVSDIMFQTVKRGKLTYGELAAALGTVVPVAATVGINFEEVAAALASLTRQGIKVQTATMQLRQVFMAVLKPGKDAKELAEKLGLEFSVTALKAKGLGKFLADVKEKTHGSAHAYSILFKNVRAMTPVMALAGRAAEGFANDIELMGKASGSTEEAFRKQMDSADFWIETLKNSINKFKISFYTGFVDPLKTGISTSKDLEDRTKELTSAFEDLGKIVGIGVYGFFGRLIEKYRTVQGLTKTFTVLIEGSALAIKNKQIPTIKNAVKAWGEHQNVLKKQKEQTELLKQAFSRLKDAFPEESLKGLNKEFKNLKEGIIGSFGGIKTFVKILGITTNKVDKNKEAFAKLFKELTGIELFPEMAEKIEDVTEETEDATKAYKEHLASLKALISPYSTLGKEIDSAAIALSKIEIPGELPAELKSTYDGLEGIAGVIKGPLGQAVQDGKRDILGFGMTFDTTNYDIKESTKDAEQAIEKTWDELHPYWSNLCTDLGGSFGNFTASILSTGSDLSDALQGLWGDIKSSFIGMLADMAAEQARTMLVDMISTTKKGLDKVTSMTKTATDGLGKMASGLGEGIGAAIGAIGKGIATACKAIAGAAKEVAITAALALAIYAGFSLVSAIIDKLKGKGGGGDLGYTNKLLEDLVWKQQNAINRKLDQVNTNLHGILKRLNKITGAQFGAVLTSPQLVMTHGTPAMPEYIIPSRAIESFAPEPTGVQPLSKAGSFEGGLSKSSNFVINQNVKINAQTLDDYTIHRAGEKLFHEIKFQVNKIGGVI